MPHERIGYVMEPPRRKGAYAPLAAQYYLDDAILEAGPNAELMWVRILSFLASVPSNGYITERQVRIVANGLRDWRQRVAKLTEVGLLIAASDGYEARNWQKWNVTAEKRNAILAKDRERKANKRAGNGDTSDRNPAPVQTDSEPQGSKEESSEVENRSSSSEVANATPRRDVDFVLDLLDSELRANGVTKLPARNKKNVDAARLMLDRDNRTVDQVAAAIRFAQGDEFWRSNILSMSKLRDKYEQLQQAAKRSTRTSRPTRGQENMAFVARMEAQQRLGIEQ